ncbi:MAG: hypothetical protein U0R44_06970 [Candidatus Micrarchaeia archaeon]
MGEEFEGAIEEAKRLEKKIVEFAPYSGEMSIQTTIDFEPREYIDLTYRDLINLYERNQKIISTMGLGVLASKSEETSAATAETGEVESKLREMTTETLKVAEEVGKEPIALEKEVPPPQEAPREEHPPAEMKLEFETRTAEESRPSEMPGEKPEEAAPSAPEAEKRPQIQLPEEPKLEVPATERKVIVASVVPPALRESPDKAASKRYEQVEEQIRLAIGEAADEVTIKKKMLELTKQLFKEKATSKREELKLQIATLKNMLSGSAAGARSVSKGAKKTDEAHQKIFETILGAHQTELAQTKDQIIDSYNKQISTIRKKFYEDVSSTEDPAKRKQIFEAFVFSVESLLNQLPEVITKYRDFTAQKHQAELEKLRGSLGPDEKDLQNGVDGRLEYVKSRYDQEFTAVKGIVGKDIDNLIEMAGADIFKRSEEKPKDAELKAHDVVKEINETDEGTLLYFLHSKDQDYYKKYERKMLSKAEAIFKAKELMAKDKGLSDSLVKKFFIQTEG